MKKIITSTICIIIVLISCSKSDMLNNDFKSIKIDSQLNNNNKNSTYNSITITGVKTFEDMLYFENFESYKNAVTKLAELQAMDIKTFNDTYLDYSFEQINAMSELQQDELSVKMEGIENQINFSESGIYSQFETLLNFKSLRKVIATEEKVFLNNPEPNWELEPDNHFIVLDEERTLFNMYVEVRIGNSIFKITKDYAYEIMDANYSTLLELRSNGYSASMANVKLIELASTEGSSNINSNFSGKTNSDCKQTKSKSDTKSLGTKRIKWIIAANTWWSNKVVATTVNYKKTNIGWVQYKTAVSARAWGKNCSWETINAIGNSTTYSYSIKAVHPVNEGNNKIPNGELRGEHSGAGGIVYNSILTW